MRRKQIGSTRKQKDIKHKRRELAIFRIDLGKALSRAEMTSSRCSVGLKLRYTAEAASTKPSYPLFLFLIPAKSNQYIFCSYHNAFFPSSFPHELKTKSLIFTRYIHLSKIPTYSGLNASREMISGHEIEPVVFVLSNNGIFFRPYCGRRLLHDFCYFPGGARQDCKNRRTQRLFSASAVRAIAGRHKRAHALMKEPCFHDWLPR